MGKTNKIEQLKGSDRAEVLGLFSEAFQGHPLLPTLGARPEATRAVMRAFLDFFGGTKGSLLYGIRRGDKLVCAALAIDSSVEPSTLPLMRFVFTLALSLGWEVGQELEAARKEIPIAPGRYLEIVLLGTLPEYRKQGLAEDMLHFLKQEAKKQKFSGLRGMANRDTSAYELYLKEGFVVEKEFTTGATSQCWMRLTF